MECFQHHWTNPITKEAKYWPKRVCYQGGKVANSINALLDHYGFFKNVFAPNHELNKEYVTRRPKFNIIVYLREIEQRMGFLWGMRPHKSPNNYKLFNFYQISINN